MNEYNVSGIVMSDEERLSNMTEGTTSSSTPSNVTYATYTTSTYATYTPPLVATIPAIESFYFIIIISCFIVGTMGNAIALRYFLTKKRDIPTSIYIFIAIVDIIVSVLILPAAFPYLGEKSTHDKRGWIFETNVLCNLWGVMWYVFSTATVFLVAMLSITRTIHLVAPFRHLSKRAVIGFIVGYLLLLSVQSTIPMWAGKSYIYDYRQYGYCLWYSTEVLNDQDHNHTTSFHVYTQIFFFEYYFPIFPIIISCCLTIMSLKTSDNRALNDANRSVTITILLFTALYLLCNLPPVFMYLTSILKRNFKVDIDTEWDYEYQYFRKFCSLITISINSALNPVLYLSRMRQMRRSTKTMVKRCAEVASVRLGGSSTSPLMKSRKISATAVTRV